MNLDDLNRRVTNAIVHAESLPPASLEAWAAFREVSRLEESIANLTRVDELDGEIARLGAVTGALSAGEPLRAIQLAHRYQDEGVAGAAGAKLGELLKEAEADLVRATSDEPTVEPVTFTLRAA